MRTGDVGVSRQRHTSLELLPGYLPDEVELQHDYRDACLAEPSDGERLAGGRSRRRSPKGPLEPRALRKPGDPSPLSPILYRASDLAGQMVALLLYLLYELFVGIDEFLHALRL